MPNPFWKTPDFKRTIQKRKSNRAPYAPAWTQNTSSSPAAPQPKVTQPKAPTRSNEIYSGGKVIKLSEKDAPRARAIQKEWASRAPVERDQRNPYLVNRFRGGSPVEPRKVIKPYDPSYVFHDKPVEDTYTFLQDKPGQAIDVYRHFESEFDSMTKHNPLYQQYAPFKLDESLQYNDEIYYDPDNNALTNRDTGSPLYVNYVEPTGDSQVGTFTFSFTPEGNQEAGKFSRELAVQLAMEAENTYNLFSTERTRQEGGVIEDINVTEKDFERDMMTRYLEYANQETSDEVMYFKDADGNAVPFSFGRFAGTLRPMSIGEESVKSIFNGIYNGRYDGFGSDLVGLAAIAMKSIGLVLKTTWKTLTSNFSSSRELSDLTGYERFMSDPELDRKNLDSDQTGYERVMGSGTTDKDFSEWLDEAAVDANYVLSIFGFQNSKQMEDKAVSIIDAVIDRPDKRLSRAERQELTTETFKEIAPVYNDALNTPTTSENYQEKIDALMEAEIKRNVAEGMRGVGFSYDFVNNPEKEETYYARIAHATLSLGRPLTKWERLQIKETVADPVTELAGGLVFDWLNLLDVPIGSLIDVAGGAKVFNVLDDAGESIGKLATKPSGVYQALSNFGHIDDMSIGSLLTSVIWKGSFGEIGDAWKAARGAKFMERNFNYLHGWRLSTRQIVQFISDGTRNVVNRVLGGAMQHVKSSDDLLELIGIGRKAAELRRNDTGFTETVASLLSDRSVPGRFRNRTFISDVVHMVDVKSPLNKNGIAGEWTRMFGNAYDSAVTKIADEVLDVYKYNLLKALSDDDTIRNVDLSMVTKNTVTENDEVNKVIQSLQVGDDETFEQALMNGLANSANKSALDLIDSDRLSDAISSKFAETFEDTKVISQFAGTKILEGTVLGWLVQNAKKVTGKEIGTNFARMKHVHKAFMDKYMKTILGLRPAFQWMNVMENAFQVAASGKGASRRYVNLMLDNPRLVEVLGMMPDIRGRQGFYSMLGSVDTKDIAHLRELITTNPDIMVPHFFTRLEFFKKAWKDGRARWLDTLFENAGVTEKFERESILRSLAENKGLFNRKAIGDGSSEILTMFGVPVRTGKKGLVPLAGEYAGFMDALGEAGRASGSMSELVAKAFMADDTYRKGFGQIKEIALIDITEEARRIMVREGFDQDMMSEVLTRIRNNYLISQGNVTKFTERMKDILSTKGYRSDITIPDELRVIATGLKPEELDLVLSGVNKELNDFFLMVKAETGAPPEVKDVHDFFVKKTEDHLNRIRENIHPGSMQSTAILGIDGSGRLMPVSADTDTLIRELNEVGGDISKTSFAVPDYGGDRFVASITVDGKLFTGKMHKDAIGNMIASGDYEFNDMSQLIRKSDGSMVKSSEWNMAHIDNATGRTLSRDEIFSEFGTDDIDALNIRFDSGDVSSASPELLDILEENGIDTTNKTIQDAVDELLNKVTVVGSDGMYVSTQEQVVQAIEKGTPVRSMKSTFGEAYDIRDDIIEDIQIKAEIIGRVEDAANVGKTDFIDNAAGSMLEEMRAVLSDDVNIEHYKTWGKTKSELNSKVILPLQSIVESNVGGVPTDMMVLHLKLQAYQGRMEDFFRMIRDVLLPSGYPGYKMIHGKGSGKYKREAYLAANEMLNRFLKASADDMTRILGDFEKGIFNAPTTETLLGWLGGGVNFNEKGHPVSMFITTVAGSPKTFDSESDVFNLLTSWNSKRTSKGAGDMMGIRNEAMYKAPIDITRDEMRELIFDNDMTRASIVKSNDFVTAHDPFRSVYNLPEEAWDEARRNWFSAFTKQKINSMDKLEDFLKPYFPNGSISGMSGEEVATEIRRVADSLKDTSPEVAESMNKSAQFVEECDAYFVERMLKGNKDAIRPALPNQMPDDIRAWANHLLKNNAEAIGMKNVLTKWDEIIAQQIEDGHRFYPKPLGNIDVEKVNEVVDEVSQITSQIEDALWNGGVVGEKFVVSGGVTTKTGGIALEGAIPRMKQRMRVPTESAFDEAMKGIVPFWNYNTRGSAAFLTSVADHPNVLNWYQKYQKYSSASARKNGLVTSTGRPLPSTMGKIPLIKLPGMQIWMNAVSAFPFLEYYFADKDVYDYEEDDPHMFDFGYMLRKGLDFSSAYGFRVSPILSILSTLFTRNQYNTQNFWQASLSGALQGVVGIPTQLIPNWAWNGVDKIFHGLDKSKSVFMDGNEDTFRPQVQWFDPLVEQAILRDYLDKMMSTEDEEEREELALELKIILRDKEEDERYHPYVDELRQTEYWRNLAGFFTGAYARIFYNGDIELKNIRNENNALRKSINDTVSAAVFMPNIDTPEARRDIYLENRYGSAIGSLYSVANQLTWIRDANGNLINEQAPRNEEVAKLMQADIENVERYDAIEELQEEHNRQRRLTDIGTEYKDPRMKEARTAFFDGLNEISAQYAHLSGDWAVGTKTQSQVEQHFLNMYWRDLQMLRPKWDSDNDEPWTEYAIRLKEWEDNLPQLAQEFFPIFKQRALGIWTAQEYIENQSIEQVLSVVQENTDIEHYNSWERSRDDAIDALFRAWEETHWQPYHDTVGSLSGAERQLAEDRWLKQNPVPAPDQLVAWIMQQPEYAGKFTEQELKTATMTPEERAAHFEEIRKVASIEQAQTIGKTDAELMESELFDKLWWKSPKDKDFYSVFRVNAAQYGLEESDLDAFYDFGDYMMQKFPEKGENLLKALEETYAELDITEPTGKTLVERAEVQKQNEEFKQMMNMQFGEGWEDMVYSVSSLSKWDRAELKKRNPDQHAMYQAYYDLRDTFGEQNPLWAEYYMSTGSKSGGGTSYYGYGGGSGSSSRRSGSSSVVATPDSFSMMGAGTRGTMDANQLLDPENLGKGKVAGMPKLPTAFWEKTTLDLREEIYKYTIDGSPLSEAAISFLLRIAERFPEYAEEINGLIGNQTEPADSEEGEPITP